MIYRSKRVTIKEVARSAGVSTMTVSRVINQHPDVSKDTRSRVLDVIQQMGFQPSSLARSLIQQRSYTIGVITAGLKYFGPSQTLNGITVQAETLGYGVLLKEIAQFEKFEIQPLFDSLISRQVDGIVWAIPQVGSNRSFLDQGISFPVPIIFLTMEPREGIPVVSVDNYSGAVSAVRHLIDQGCTRIGHIAGPVEWWEAQQRIRGWETALREAGLPAESRQCVSGNWSSASGEMAFQRRLDQFPEMDAVFAGNDQMALSLLQVASRMAMRVPQDLAVVGFDHLAESPYFQPSLSTIRTDQKQVGELAVQELVRMIQSVWSPEIPYEPQAIMIHPELVVRESSLANRR